MDIADQAQAEIERMNVMASRTSSAKTMPVSAEFCAECGEPIPEARRLAVPGCRLCIECQTERECG